MSGYNAIADVGSFIVDMLRRGMVPELVASGDSIALGGAENDSIVTLTLYDVQILSRSYARDYSGSSPMSLKYMLSVNYKADAHMKAEAEHKILGRAIGILNGTPVIRNVTLLGSGDIPIELSMVNVETDERIKICDHIFGAFRTSVFYCAEPVFIDTGVVGKAERVLNG